MLHPCSNQPKARPLPPTPALLACWPRLRQRRTDLELTLTDRWRRGWKKPEAYGDRPSSHAWKSPSDWADDDPADDVSALSYERALRTHSRYRAPDLNDTSLTNPPKPRFVDSYELAPEETQPANAAPPAPSASRRVATGEEGKFHQDSAAAEQPRAACRPSTPFERNLKNASITIRMSKEECTQLHRRAAEAGLTVSAYLRSCTFEAESLRALVKTPWHSYGMRQPREHQWRRPRSKVAGWSG